MITYIMISCKYNDIIQIIKDIEFNNQYFSVDEAFRFLKAFEIRPEMVNRKKIIKIN